MKQYSHLTESERYQISALKKSNHSLCYIARFLGRNKSTISREIGRNEGLRGYRPAQANQRAKARSARANASRLTEFFWSYVDHLLSKYYSPEQINGRLKQLGFLGVASIEHIYRYIYADKKQGGSLHKFLRSQKKYRKRKGSGQDRRGKIPNRRGIEERHINADNRTQIGHMEADLMMGKDHKGAVFTVIDRVSLYAKIRAVPNKSSKAVKEACVQSLSQMHIKTITFDNGKEFSLHQEVDIELNCVSYFADPYSSWQRGTNENYNGLVRQFLPKKERLDTVSDEKIQWIEDNLNNRPRKTLGYLTPNEVLSRIHTVALRS